MSEGRWIRLGITVEGWTEEAFVNRVLKNHLLPMAVEPFPVVLGRARSHGEGGHVTVDRLVSDMLALRKNFDAVTSLVDFYGFDGKKDLSVEALEKCLQEEIRRRAKGIGNVFPYVQRHEFEGLLFSDVSAFRVLKFSREQIDRLADVRKRFATPEDIDDGPDTAPSKRIAKVASGDADGISVAAKTTRRYRKRVDGPRVALATGLTRIREECPRFNAWLARLEGLA